MTWRALKADVRDEFIEAQRLLLDRARRRGWAMHSLYVARQHANKRRYSLLQLRLRIHARPVITCKNPKCAVQFVAYHALTTYCTIKCRVRHLSLQQYYKRRDATVVERESKRERACQACGHRFTDRKLDAIYCSRRCNRAAVTARTLCAGVARARRVRRPPP